MFKKIIGHFCTITHHKWIVFKLCVRAGIPWRGFMHDWSKYSPIEFWESVKYYTGKRSPIVYCKQEKGYSKAWLHHKGRNKHHFEYWYDYAAPEPTPIIPYKYVVEMLCDTLAAGIVYNGKDWTNSSQKEYWDRTKHIVKLNPKIFALEEAVYLEVEKRGIKEVITSKNLKKMYKEYVG